MKTDCSRRGATKHWVIGCLVALVLFIVVVVGVVGAGGYFVYKKTAPSSFDVATKTDPPVLATRAEIFPGKVGDLELEEGDLAAGPVADFQHTSGVLTTVYVARGEDKSVHIAAIPTGQMKEMQKRNTTFSRMNQNPSSGNNTGYSFRIPFGETPSEMAFWGKKNWSFFVFTTSTSALNFAKEFNPRREAQAEETPAGSTSQ